MKKSHFCVFFNLYLFLRFLLFFVSFFCFFLIAFFISAFFTTFDRHPYFNFTLTIFSLFNKLHFFTNKFCAIFILIFSALNIQFKFRKRRT